MQKENSLSFEQAWPEIKAGKLCSVKAYGKEFSDYLTLFEISKYFTLDQLADAKFQIKREPREFFVGVDAFGYIKEQRPNKDGFHPDLTPIKVREVLD